MVLFLDLPKQNPWVDRLTGGTPGQGKEHHRTFGPSKKRSVAGENMEDTLPSFFLFHAVPKKGCQRELCGKAFITGGVFFSLTKGPRLRLNPKNMPKRFGNPRRKKQQDMGKAWNPEMFSTQKDFQKGSHLVSKRSSNCSKAEILWKPMFM